VAIPSGTVVTASSSSWNGVISAPTIKTSTSVPVSTPSGYTATLGTVIDLGSSNVDLTFDQPVKLTIPGEAHKLVGFIKDGSFTQITDACSTSNPTITELQADQGGACYKNSGSNLIVWTDHFTEFVTYTQAKSSSTSSSSTNSSSSTSGTAVLTTSSLSTGNSAKVLGAKTNKPSHTAISAAATTTPSVATTAAASPQAASKLLGLKWYWWLAILAVAAALGSAIRVYRQTGEKR
jgi:hypothetical protein